MNRSAPALPKLPAPLTARGDFPAFQAKIAMNCYSAVQMDERWREGYEAGRASGASVATWQLIETAPKDADALILGFAPDEEDYSLPTREGWWNKDGNCWVVSIDANYFGHGQPTHWMPLPAAPGAATLMPPVQEPIPQAGPGSRDGGV